jgi:Zn-dependent peptidase ImmA (M78 family)
MAGDICLRLLRCLARGEGAGKQRMERVRINGRTYSDPDVVSLIRSSVHPIDPQHEVVRRARELNQLLRNFGDVPPEPRKRLEILASLARVKMAPANGPGMGKGGREALIYRDSDGSSRAYYDSTNADARVNFTIAHEIAHTFFPSVGGARFRSMCADDSKEANELEMLCHRAAAELLMPIEEFSETLAGGMGLGFVPRLCARFGSSYEATVYRLATAYPGVAVAGLLRYRHRVEDMRRMKSRNQRSLFGHDDWKLTPPPKLRRQSVHISEGAEARHTIRWNKSFDDDSCVYRAATELGVHASWEPLPNECGDCGDIEAIRAPHQNPENDPTQPDILFLWWL